MMDNIVELKKVERLYSILNEAKKIIMELEGYASKREEQARNMERTLATNILNFGFSVRILNILKQVDAKTIGDVAKLTRQDLLKINRCGRMALLELERKLDEVGVKLAEENEY